MGSKCNKHVYGLKNYYINNTRKAFLCICPQTQLTSIKMDYTPNDKLGDLVLYFLTLIFKENFFIEQEENKPNKYSTCGGGENESDIFPSAWL